MPFLNLKTNITLKNKNEFAEAASNTLANMLGKPESYVMVNIEDNQCLMFAGNHQPCAHIKIKSLGLDENQTSVFSKQLCEFVESQTPIKSDRIYIEFHSPARHMWGWDKRTF